MPFCGHHFRLLADPLPTTRREQSQTLQEAVEGGRKAFAAVKAGLQVLHDSDDFRCLSWASLPPRHIFAVDQYVKWPVANQECTVVVVKLRSASWRHKPAMLLAQHALALQPPILVDGRPRG